MPTSLSDLAKSIQRVNCAEPGRGAWKVLVEQTRRRIRVRNSRTKADYVVYYGTRTERTQEQAELHATAMCAVLNALKAKRLVSVVGTRHASTFRVAQSLMAQRKTKPRALGCT